MKRIAPYLPYLPYILLSLWVMGPLLAPGYVLSMDMVFTPVLRMPEQVDNTYLFYSLLHVLNWVVPADLLQKVMLLAILLLSGVGMHRLLLALQPLRQDYWRLGIYAGSILFMINPFVYDRFMAGQYGVLLGYALLPWFAAALYRFVRLPGASSMLVMVVWLWAISIVSIHTIGFALILLLLALLMHARRRLKLQLLLKWSAIGLGVWALIGAYWLVPAALGQNKIAVSIGTFTAQQRQAFATVDSLGVSPVGTVMGLHGFWQDVKQLYTLPLQAGWWWGLVYLILLILLAVGAVRAFRRQRLVAVYALVVLAIAVLLAVGVGGDWLATYVLFYAGYREPQKFVALVALVYGYFAVWAAAGMLQWASKKNGRFFGPGMRKGWRWLKPATLAGMVALPLLFTPTMRWGFDGQLRAVQYPEGWFVANKMLGKADKALFLPWHLYMSFGFSGRIIATPAPAFFDAKIVSSDDPELRGVSAQTPDAVREKVQNEILPAAAQGHPIAPELKKLGINRVILAKELDYDKYSYLDSQPDITLIGDWPDIRLYGLK